MEHTRVRSRALSTAIRLAIIACLILGTMVAPGFAAAANVATASPVRAAGPAPVAAAADTTAPVTYSDAWAVYDGQADITLFPYDADSGVAATYYKLDGGAETAGTQITVSTGGSHLLEFWSVDVAGNIEKSKSAPFVVIAVVPDHIAPNTTSDVKASYPGQALVGLDATDNDDGSGVQHTYYRLDGAEAVDGVTVMTSVMGPHTLEYWSVDAASNEETPHKTASFSVTPMATTVTIKTAATTTNVGKTVTLSGAMTPVGVVGQIMVVYVMKPGSARWTYSSNRVVYTLAGVAAWQYKYYFKPGMAKGTYKYKAVFPANAGFPTCTSPNTVSIRVR